MSTETRSKDYRLKGNPVVVPTEVPVVGNLINDDLGQEVLAKLNERFRGVSSIEYAGSRMPNAGEPLRYSNTPRALAIDQILREIAPDMHVLSVPEVVQYWNAIPDRSSTYADTNAVVIYPNEGPREALRKKVLKDLGLKSAKVPMLIERLGIKKAKNDEGFTFVRGDLTQAIEAPFLKKDGRVAYDARKGIVQSPEGVYIWTSSDQSGLWWVFRYGSGGVYARDGIMVVAGEGGRVQVAQAPKARSA